MAADLLGEGVAGARGTVSGAFLLGERGGCGVTRGSDGTASCACSRAICWRISACLRCSSALRLT